MADSTEAQDMAAMLQLAVTLERERDRWREWAIVSWLVTGILVASFVWMVVAIDAEQSARPAARLDDLARAAESLRVAAVDAAEACRNGR